MTKYENNHANNTHMMALSPKSTNLIGHLVQLSSRGFEGYSNASKTTTV